MSSQDCDTRSGKSVVNKGIQLWLKRVIDIILSLIGLAILGIPFALIAVAIKLDSKGPVFFRQERVRRWEDEKLGRWEAG